MTRSRPQRVGKAGDGIERITAFPPNQANLDSSSYFGLSSAELSLADVAAKVPLKVPNLPENPLLARRYTPLGNTFLNWEGGDEGVIGEEAEKIDESELASWKREWRHTFGQFGHSELAARPFTNSIDFEGRCLFVGSPGSPIGSAQVERSSFGVDAMKQPDRLSFHDIDHTSDVNLERLPDGWDQMSNLKLRADDELETRADELLPALERESFHYSCGRLSRRNSFQQSLDAKLTREEEDFEACEQIPSWDFRPTLNSFDHSTDSNANEYLVFEKEEVPVNCMSVYRTFDPWNGNDLEDTELQRPWDEEQPKILQPLQEHLDDRKTHQAPEPVRVSLAQFIPPQRLQQCSLKASQSLQEKPEKPRKLAASKVLPPEGNVLPQALQLQPPSNLNQTIAEGKPVTTLMIRNIPTWYTQDMLLNEWPNEGTYNLLYLPFCFRTKKNLAFAFVNFTKPEHAEAFRLRWHKRSLQTHTSRKTLDVSEADVQGQFETLQKLTKNKACRIRNVHYQPAIFVDDTRCTVEEYLTIRQFGGLPTKIGSEMPWLPERGCSPGLMMNEAVHASLVSLNAF